MRPTANVSRLVLSAAVALALAALAPVSLADETPPPAAPAAPPKDAVRIEMGKPLSAVQDLIKEKKYRDALAKLKEAETIAGRTPYENYVIDRLRAQAAAGAGENEMAAGALENVVNSGRLPAADQLRMILAISNAYYQLKFYAKSANWAQRYQKEGGTEPGAEDMILNSLYLGNDFAGAAAEVKNIIEADQKAGRVTPEQRLQILLTCQQRIGDQQGQVATLEKLLESYPSKQYWEIAISKLEHKSGFAERLEIDLLRLRFALGDLKREGDFMELAQLALDVGFPAEAKRVVDEGYRSGVLGKGNDIDRQKRLQVKVTHDAAEDARTLGLGDMDAEKAKGGDAMVNTGYNYVLNGKFDHGLSLMEAGLKKGGLKHAEDAKLHLGLAYLQAGQKARAASILRTVSGNDGTADLAHLWALYASR